MNNIDKHIVVIGVITLLSWLAMIWVGAYLWTILPQWTQFPMIATGISVTVIALGIFSLWNDR
jgi:hypothetical protein